MTQPCPPGADASSGSTASTASAASVTPAASAGSAVSPEPSGEAAPHAASSERAKPLAHAPASFRRLAAANLSAQAAEQLSLAAVPMVAVLWLGAGPRETGWLAAAQSLPFLLLALPFGLLADRTSHRRLMVVAEALRVVAMAGLGWVAWVVAAGLAPSAAITLLAGLGFLGAVGTVAFSVAAPAFVASVVPGPALPRANGQLELARSLAFAAGPALAGALVAAAGGAAAFLLAAALSAAAVGLLMRLPEQSSHDGARHAATPATAQATAASLPTRSLRAELREGANFVWRHPLLRPILLTAVAWNTSWMVLQAAFVPHAMQHLGLGAKGVGITMSLYGAGMVLGALAAPRLMARLPTGGAIAIGPLVSVAAALAMVATLAMPKAGLAALSFFLFGAGPIVWTVSSTTLRQRLTPSAMLGRVSSIFLAANAGARPVGAALASLLAWALADDGRAITACLLVAAAGFGLQALLILLSPVMRLRETPAPVNAAPPR